MHNFRIVILWRLHNILTGFLGGKRPFSYGNGWWPHRRAGGGRSQIAPTRTTAEASHPPYGEQTGARGEKCCPFRRDPEWHAVPIRSFASLGFRLQAPTPTSSPSIVAYPASVHSASPAPFRGESLQKRHCLFYRSHPELVELLGQSPKSTR